MGVLDDPDVPLICPATRRLVDDQIGIQDKRDESSSREEICCQHSVGNELM